MNKTRIGIVVLTGASGFAFGYLQGLVTLSEFHPLWFVLATLTTYIAANCMEDS